MDRSEGIEGEGSDEHDKEYYKFEGKVDTNMVNQITNKIVDGVVFFP